MRHIYLWSGSAYGGDIINRLQSGHIQYSRPFGLGYTEATLVFQASSEAAAYAEFPKGLKVKITDDSLTGSRYDGTTLLVGYVDRTAWNESSKTVRITLKDYLYLSLDRKVGPVGFISKQVSDIVSWVASQAGVSVLYRPASRYEPTIPYHFFEEQTVQNILSTIAMDLGGKMYCSVSEPHVLVVEYGCLYSSYSPTALTSIDLNDVEDFDIDMPARQPNVFECEGKNKSLKSGILFESANYENPWTIPAGGIGVTNDHFIEFDRAVVYIDEMVFDADAGITFDETVWASNFVDNDISKPLKNPYKAKIKITASTEGDVWKFRLKGRAVHEDKQVVTKDNSGSGIKRNWKHTSDMLYDSSAVTWLSRRVTWEAAKKGDSFSFAIISGKYPFFGPHTSVSPDYIINVSGAYVAITDMTLELGSGKLNVQGIGDRSGYDPTLTDDYGDITVPTIPVLPEFGDGVAPATPTGLSLSTFYREGKAYVKADWADNTETDLKGYELRWSYDNTNWINAGFVAASEQTFEVSPNGVVGSQYTVYVQVRAVDLEKLASAWATSTSISVSIDSAVPAAPASITAYSGVGLIYIRWSKVNDVDLNNYVLERRVQTSDGGAWSGWSELVILKSTEYVDESVDYHIQNSPEDSAYPNQWRKYTYRVKAVDHAGNASSYATSAAAYADQATGADIKVNTVKANHLEATLDLLVGRQIRVGSGIQIGAGVGPVGSTFDGIYVTDGTNYVKLSASKLEMKADLVLGEGDNAIHFEDGKIDMVDGGFADYSGWVDMYWTPTNTKFSSYGYLSRENYYNMGFLTLESDYYNGAEREGHARLVFEAQSTPSSGMDFVSLQWKAGDISKRWYYFQDGDFSIYGFVSFNDYIKFGIPTWYGTKTTATNKYPNWTDWTDPENCPNSNIWIWLKTGGLGPTYVLYFKTPHDGATYSYWVALNRYTL